MKNKISRQLREIAYLTIGVIRFRLFVARADMMHHTTGKRYYVIPHPTSRFKLLVLCKDDIRRLKKARILRKNVDHLFIMHECLYFTDLDGKPYGRMQDVEKNEHIWKQHIRAKVHQ